MQFTLNAMSELSFILLSTRQRLNLTGVYTRYSILEICFCGYPDTSGTATRPGAGLSVRGLACGQGSVELQSERKRVVSEALQIEPSSSVITFQLPGVYRVCCRRCMLAGEERCLKGAGASFPTRLGLTHDPSEGMTRSPPLHV